MKVEKEQFNDGQNPEPENGSSSDRQVSDIEQFVEDHNSSFQHAINSVNAGQAYREPVLDASGKEVGEKYKLKKDDSVIFYREYPPADPRKN